VTSQTFFQEKGALFHEELYQRIGRSESGFAAVLPESNKRTDKTTAEACNEYDVWNSSGKQLPFDGNWALAGGGHTAEKDGKSVVIGIEKVCRQKNGLGELSQKCGEIC